MTDITRRRALGLGAGTFMAAILAGHVRLAGADPSTLTIAFNSNLPSFDGTVGPSSVNPTIQAIYRAIFDQYIGQAPDLSFKPGLLTSWGWSEDKAKVFMEVRSGVKWHDGTPLRKSARKASRRSRSGPGLTRWMPMRAMPSCG